MMTMKLRRIKYLHECGGLVHVHQHTEELPLDWNDDDYDDDGDVFELFLFDFVRESESGVFSRAKVGIKIQKEGLSLEKG